MPFPLGNHSKYSQRWLLVVVVSMKCFCKLKSEYCSTTQNCLFKILSLSAKHWWSKSTQRAKYDFSRELEKTLSEESRRERESVCKISFFREVKENFFQNLEFREENENFFFKILTFESISRNENSILQLEIEKNGPFPLEIFSRSRISSMPGWGIGLGSGSCIRWICPAPTCCLFADMTVSSCSTQKFALKFAVNFPQGAHSGL